MLKYLFQIQHIVTATLVWLWSRHDLPQKVKTVVTLMLVFTSYKPFILELLIATMSTGPWVGLLLKAFVTIMHGSFTLMIYSGFAQVIGVY